MTVVIKDGANGCHYTAQGVRHTFPTEEVKQVIDTTAAGDSFNAGFIYYWLQEQPIEHCAIAGNVTAGQVIQQKGAIVPLDVANITLRIAT